jgi:hypothetical protein
MLLVGALVRMTSASAITAIGAQLWGDAAVGVAMDGEPA